MARIKEYVQDGKEAFFRDRKTQDAVIRNLEVIGQAVKDIGVGELATTQPGVPWAQVAGARNIPAHHYKEHDRVVLTTELPTDSRARSSPPEMSVVRPAAEADIEDAFHWYEGRSFSVSCGRSSAWS